MIKEPISKGAAFLVRFQKEYLQRDFILVLHDVPYSFLREVSQEIRQISRLSPDWKVKTASIQDATFPRHEIPDLDPGYFCLDIRHFAGLSSAGNTLVHRDLLRRVIQRLLSDTPGTDFIQKSGIARGLRYFDRPKVREDLLNQIMGKRWILLEAVRRFGKTSFLVNLEERPPEGMIIVYVSLESGSSRKYLTRALLAHAMKNSQLRSLISRNLKEGVEKTWSAIEILEHFTTTNKGMNHDLHLFWKALSKTKIKVLFLLDEAAIYFQNVKEYRSDKQDDINRAWKGWLTECLDLLNKAPEQVRFVLAGSLHLPAFLQAHEVAPQVFKERISLSLSPVSEGDIETFLRLALLQENILTEEYEMSWILNKFGGWLPSFLIYFIDLLSRECRDHSRLSLNEIKSLYLSLFESKHRDLFADLDEQPKRYGTLFDPSILFSQRLQHLLVMAVEKGASLEEIKKAFHQAKDYRLSVRPKESERLLDLALKIASQDFSLGIKEGNVLIHCPLIADWIKSRKMEWRVY